MNEKYDNLNYEEQYNILCLAEEILRDYFYAEELGISLNRFADCMYTINRAKREINEYIVMIKDGIIKNPYDIDDELAF